MNDSRSTSITEIVQMLSKYIPEYSRVLRAYLWIASPVLQYQVVYSTGYDEQRKVIQVTLATLSEIRFSISIFFVYNLAEQLTHHDFTNMTEKFLAGAEILLSRHRTTDAHK